MLSRNRALLSMALALVCTTAHAADPGPIATTSGVNDAPLAKAAPTASKDESTAGQISAWISDDGEVTNQQGDQPPVKAPRAVHGEIDAAVGTGGFHGVSGVADIPVGDQGDLIVAGSNSSGRFRRGPSYQNNSLSLGLFLGGATPNSGCDRPRWGDTLGVDAVRNPGCSRSANAGQPYSQQGETPPEP